MLSQPFSSSKREMHSRALSAEFVVIGGGFAGVCAAVTAARSGTKTILVQDRPVLGGNASSEVRLWILGATSHMGNNNRWSREGGLVDEILIENLYRNKEGNPVILDTILLEKAYQEPNITLLLNTAVWDIEKADPQTVSKVYAFCSQNSTFYEISGRLFCDASGDGILAYRAGAAFRMGAEEKRCYNEQFAPDKGEFGELLGHSIYFYSLDTGKPVKFVPPSYALKDITRIPRWRKISSSEHGCRFWWLEYGGRLDTIHDTEQIKWEIWSVVYGVWDYIKNSGNFPDAENLTLSWVGTIPGKRESRRFEGEYTLVQQDIIEQRHHPDAVAFGGWAIDLHPADGVYSSQNGCIQYHSKGIYEIPYRCYCSRDIRNLFLAGRCISASHVAHGSTRVMATSGFGAQAIGMAAALCLQKGVLPADLTRPEFMRLLQQRLNLAGQSIPGIRIDSAGNLAASARISASSELRLAEIPFDGGWMPLDYSAAQLLPLKAGVRYRFEIEVEACEATVLEAELRYAAKPFNYTPDMTAERVRIPVEMGTCKLSVVFTGTVPSDQYGFVTFLKNNALRIRSSKARYTGIVSVFNKFNEAVNNNGRQTPPAGSGIDAFEFWCPDRRPAGQNIAMRITPAIEAFSPSNVVNGFVRPTVTANAWCAAFGDKMPRLSFCWDVPQRIGRIRLFFDTDYDHALESVQMGHPERVIPFCVQGYRILDGHGNVVCECTDNHQTINDIRLKETLETDRLAIVVEHPSSEVAAALFQIHIEA